MNTVFPHGGDVFRDSPKTHLPGFMQMGYFPLESKAKYSSFKDISVILIFVITSDEQPYGSTSLLDFCC